MTDLDKLATAMGYVKISNYTGSFADQQGTEHWTHPDGYAVFEVPDPENDANDCEVLIRFLQNKKYEPTIAFRIGYDVVTMHDSPKILSWQGDNWKQGVCELALKVIAAHSDQRQID